MVQSVFPLQGFIILNYGTYKPELLRLKECADGKGTLMQICGLFPIEFAILQPECRLCLNEHLETALGSIGQSLVMYVVVSLMGLIDYNP